jgi:hypothetical protein
MSAFDDERKKLGLPTGTKKSTTSAFDNDRMDLGLIKDTRTKPEAKKEEVKSIPKTQAEANVSTKISDTLKGKVPAASALVTPNSFGNNAITQFNDKLPAASLLTAGTGGPSSASKIKGNGNSQYETTKKEIADSGAPGAIKTYANAMNYITQGNPVGQAISRSFAGNSGATSRDSTGNKTVDKVTDVVNNLVTPFITPTGAPVGQGIIGSTYDATGRALSGKVGQSVLKGAGKVIPGSDDVVRVAATEGLAGGLQGVGFGLQQGQDSGNEIARNALYGVAGGAVLGGLGQAGSELVSKALLRGELPSGQIAGASAEPLSAEVAPITRNQPTLSAQKVPTTAFNEENVIDDLVNAIESRGVTLSLDDLKSLDDEVASAQRRGMTGEDFQRSMNNVVDSFAPSRVTTFAEVPAQPVNKAAEAPIPAKTVDPVVTPKQIIKANEVTTIDPVTEVKPPVVTQRGFTETLKASEKTPAQVKAKLNNEYTPITNLETVEKANARLKADADAETSRVLSAKKFDAEDSVVAQRLIDHYNKQGNYEMSVTIADKVAEEATKAGQFIQSLSIYDRLTPEGVLIRAKRIEKRVNETASKIGKAAKVTDDMAKDIVDLAGVTQKMTGVKDLSNNVIDILERAKKGEALTSNEASHQSGLLRKQPSRKRLLNLQQRSRISG